MKKINFFLAGFILAGMVAFVPAVSAQTEDGNLDTLEGVEVQIPEETPSNFGLWWRGIKESVSLLFTFDPVAKVEKQLQYAEERVAIAEKMAESENDAVQERAREMFESAENYMEKVEAQKNRWTERIEERVQTMVKNLANHQVRKQEVLDRIEARVSNSSLQKWTETRREAVQKSQRLLNAIENENLPETIQEHLETVKTRIEERAQEVEDFVEEKNDLLERIQDGDEDAQEKLEDLIDDHRETIQERQRLLWDDEDKEDNDLGSGSRSRNRAN